MAGVCGRRPVTLAGASISRLARPFRREAPEACAVPSQVTGRALASNSERQDREWLLQERVRGWGEVCTGSDTGSGSVGDTGLQVRATNGETVAVKLDSQKARRPQLLDGSRVHRMVQGGLGVLQVRWSGQDVLVTHRLGPSLQDSSISVPEGSQ